MPMRVVENADGCPDERPWGLENTDTGEIEGCYASEEECREAMDAMDDGDGEASQERRMFAVLCVEGYATGDGRLLEIGQGSWRNPPLPAMAQTENPEWGGHAGAFLAGRWETLTRLDDGRRIYAEGALSLADEKGQWLETQIESGNLRFVSIDVMEADVDYEVRVVDEDGWPEEVLARFSEYVIGGATLCPFPAIDLAVVWLEGMDEPAEFAQALPDPIERLDEPEVVEGEGEDRGVVILASGDDVSALPLSTWFEDPELSQLTAWTVDGDRIFGHVAAWGTCHTGRDGCVTPPRSDSGYAYFRTGETLARCDCEGDPDLAPHVVRVPTGVITLGTGHAQSGLGAQQAMWHYEHTGAAVADVAAGEDEHGIWIAGALRRGVTDEQRQQLRGASPSGDWRRIGGGLEMLAVLAVNVPGFPVPRRPGAHLVASSVPGRMEQTSLVHPLGTPLPGGPPRGGHGTRSHVLISRAEWEATQAELRAMRPVVEALRPMANDALAASLRG